MTEKRSIKNGRLSIESRDDGAKIITGYAAVFYDPSEKGTEYQLMPGTYERIGRGAFSRALAENQDCRALFNHNADFILGRTANGTCRLSVDDRGLRYEIECPDTQLGRDLMESIGRGDITGSSFSFMVKSRSWVTDEDEEEEDRRTTVIDDLDLFDVGPVVYPAYEATTASTRSAEIEKSFEDWKLGNNHHVPHSLTGPKLAKIRISEKYFS